MVQHFGDVLDHRSSAVIAESVVRESRTEPPYPAIASFLVMAMTSLPEGIRLAPKRVFLLNQR
jgi:hypothetical protein